MKRRWDVLIFLAVALALLVLQAVALRVDLGRASRDADIIRENEASHGIALVDAWVRERCSMVSTLAQTLAFTRKSDISSSLGHLISAVHGDAENTYVGFFDGSIAYFGKWTPPPNLDITRRPWFTKARGRDEVVVTGPYQAVRTKRQVIAFAESFTVLGGMRGVVSNAVPVSRVGELLRIGQTDYSVTVFDVPTVITRRSRGHAASLAKTFTGTTVNGWTVSYQLTSGLDTHQFFAILLRHLIQWLLAVLAACAAWVVTGSYMTGKTKTAIKDLKATRKVAAPANLSDLPSTIVALSRDVVAFPEVMLRMLSFKNHYTEQHSRKVAELSTAIGQRLALPPENVSELHLAAILHDIGKVGIPETILNAPRALMDDEWSKMKEHPGMGSEVARRAGMKSRIFVAVRDHHERLDGSGYPAGRSDDEIGLLARIIAVADVYDAMTSDRPYRKALSSDLAFELLRDGSLFDQTVVDALRTVVGEKEPDEGEAMIGALPS